MAKAIGIRQNAIQVIISGARVAYDPRPTSEVENTRDPKNYKADEKPIRTRRWERNEALKRAQRNGEAA